MDKEEIIRQAKKLIEPPLFGASILLWDRNSMMSFRAARYTRMAEALARYAAMVKEQACEDDLEDLLDQFA